MTLTDCRKTLPSDSDLSPHHLQRPGRWGVGPQVVGSFRRTPESRTSTELWTPASAGVTSKESSGLFFYSQLFAAFISLVLCSSSLVLAQDKGELVLSLDDYVDLAIKQGIQGLENQLSFIGAGYTRQIAFRRTDSPTLSASLSGTRNQTVTNGNPPSLNLLTGQFAADNGQQKTDTRQAGLNLNETTPFGATLKLSGLATHTSLTGLGGASDLNNPGYKAGLTQPLYIFVKNSVARTRRQAQLAYDTARESFESAVLSLRFQAKSLYYGVMQSEEAIQVAERKVNSSRKLLDVTQALVDAGRSASVEAMRAKITLQTDQRRLDNSRVALDKAALKAKDFIYLPLDQRIRFATKLQFKPFSVPLERLIDYAMLHQPQLKSLHFAKELAKLSYEASVEPTRPMLSLNSDYNYSENAPTIMRGWTIGAAATWTFFDSFVTRDEANIAKIGLRVADLNLIAGERTTRLNVQSAYLDVKNAERQINDFQNSREQARRNVEVVRLRFQKGLDRLIDVFDAENEMRDLDNEYLNLLVNYNVLKDTLSQQVGVDVETLR